MNRFRALILAAGVIALPLTSAPLTASTAATPVKPAQTPPTSALDRMPDGIAMLQEGRFGDAEALFKEMIADPAYPTLPVEARSGLQFMLASAQSGGGDSQAAYDTLTAVKDNFPEAIAVYYWLLYGEVALDLDKEREGIDAYSRAFTLDGSTASEFNPEFISYLSRTAKGMDDGGVLYRALLESLWSAKYVPSKPFWSSQYYWYALFEARADAGEDGKARELLPVLTEPDYVITLRTDKRFARFATDPGIHLDFVAALDDELATKKAVAAAHPELIDGPIYVAGLLMTRNRLDDALGLIDGAIAKVEAAPKDKPAFTDQDEQLRWAHNTRAGILALMGRHDDALAAMIKARDIAAAGDDTVSQAINLGDYYYAQGKPNEALDAVKTITGDKDASPYGMMAAGEVRACAYAQQGDKANLTKTLDYMRGHAKDGYRPLGSALACVDDQDELAKVFIARLDDPDERASALTDAQTYLPLPHPTSVEAKMKATWKAVLARPDVLAAVAKYGVIERFPIFAAGN